MAERLAPFRQFIATALVTLVGVVLTTVLAHPGLSWQFRAAIGGAAVVTVLMLMSDERAIRLHLDLVLLTFAFGWRTVKIDGVIIDAQQVIAWLLLIHLLIILVIRPGLLQMHSWRFGIVAFIIVLYGLIVGLILNKDILKILNEIGPLLLSIPVIIGISTLVVDKQAQLRTALVIAIAVLIVALPGIASYIQPTAGSTIYRADAGVVRANFPLWGGSPAGYALVPMVLLLAPYTVARIAPVSTNWLIRFAFCFGLVAILISGQRGAWIALTLGLLVYSLLSRTWRLPLMVAIILGLIFIPKPIRDSLFVLTEVDTATAYNSSVLTRFHRAENTLKLISEHPLLGNGLSAAGWAHSDILQLAANLGLPAALMLLIGWFSPLIPIWREQRAATTASEIYRDRSLVLAGLIGAAVASLILLATQALIVISALVLPVWIVIGLLKAEASRLR